MRLLHHSLWALVCWMRLEASSPEVFTRWKSIKIWLGSEGKYGRHGLRTCESVRQPDSNTCKGSRGRSVMLFDLWIWKLMKACDAKWALEGLWSVLCSWHWNFVCWGIETYMWPMLHTCQHFQMEAEVLWKDQVPCYTRLAGCSELDQGTKLEVHACLWLVALRVKTWESCCWTSI